jgi:hypothetical protein|tara:strand:- start:380 stop:781 length:402 start_codon:yes stop_codon:yes gene_type:complete
MENRANPVDAWHLSLEKNDPNILYDVLDDSFEFFSPAVFKSKEKYMGFIYLMAASETFLGKDFSYKRQIIGEDNAVLEFECTINDVAVNGVDLFKWNEDNKFTEMKVMIRTEKALDAVKSEMTKHLMRPEIWR